MRAEIICRADSHRKAGTWYGDWIIQAVDDDRSFVRLLVKIPRSAVGAEEIEPRRFKTLNGLFSFMLDMGFTHVDVPAREGERTLQVLPSDLVESDE